MEMKPNFGTRRLREDDHFAVRDLAGHWAMSEGSGEIVHDLTRNDNNGTMTNMVPEQDWVAGDRGWATEYDGSDESVNTGDIDILDGLGAFSIVARIRPDFGPTEAVDHFVYDKSRPRLSYHDGFRDFRFQVNLSGANPDVITSGLTWTSGTWHQIVATYDGAQASLWWDGVFQIADNGDGTVTPNALPYRIGNSFAQNQGWLGAIDFVSIYSRALLADEIRQLHDFPNIVYAPRFPAYLFAGAVVPPTPGIAVEYDILDFTRTPDVLDFDRTRDELDFSREYDVLDFERP